MSEGSSQPKYVWPPRGDDAEPTAEVHHVLNMNEEDLEDVDKVNQAIELLHAEHGQNPEARSTIRKAIQEVRERLQNKANATKAEYGPTRLLTYDGEPTRSAEHGAYDTVTGEPVTVVFEGDSANFRDAPITREGVAETSREDAINVEFESSDLFSAEEGGADRRAEEEPLVSVEDTVEARENSTQPDDVVGFGREYPDGGVSGDVAPVEESDDAEAVPVDLDFEQDEGRHVTSEEAEVVQVASNYEQAPVLPTIEVAEGDEGHTTHREGRDEAHPAPNAEEEHRVAAAVGGRRNNRNTHAPHRPTNGHSAGSHGGHGKHAGFSWFAGIFGYIWYHVQDFWKTKIIKGNWGSHKSSSSSSHKEGGPAEAHH